MESTNNLENKVSKRNLISLALLAFLMLGIPIGVYLAQKTQIFTPSATVQSIQIKDEQGRPLPTNNDGTPVTNSTRIKVTLEAPELP